MMQFSGGQKYKFIITYYPHTFKANSVELYKNTFIIFYKLEAILLKTLVI